MGKHRHRVGATLKTGSHPADGRGASGRGLVRRRDCQGIRSACGTVERVVSQSASKPPSPTRDRNGNDRAYWMALAKPGWCS